MGHLRRGPRWVRHSIVPRTSREADQRGLQRAVYHPHKRRWSPDCRLAFHPRKTTLGVASSVRCKKFTPKKALGSSRRSIYRICVSFPNGLSFLIRHDNQRTRIVLLILGRPAAMSGVFEKSGTKRNVHTLFKCYQMSRSYKTCPRMYV